MAAPASERSGAGGHDPRSGRGVTTDPARDGATNTFCFAPPVAGQVACSIVSETRMFRASQTARHRSTGTCRQAFGTAYKDPSSCGPLSVATFRVTSWQRLHARGNNNIHSTLANVTAHICAQRTDQVHRCCHSKLLLLRHGDRQQPDTWEEAVRGCAVAATKCTVGECADSFVQVPKRITSCPTTRQLAGLPASAEHCLPRHRGPEAIEGGCDLNGIRSARAHWLAGPAQTAVRLRTGGQSLAVGLHGAVSDNDIERTYAPTPLTALILECSNRLLWARSRIGRCKRSHPLLLAPLLSSLICVLD